MDRAQFLRLSKDLVGLDISPRLAESLLARFRETVSMAQLNRLQVVVEKLPADPKQREAAIEARIMDVPTLRKLAKTIIVLWYTGDLLNTKKGKVSDVPEEHYFSGQMWVVARAHPPGLSGGYFGHWAYPPDN